MILNKYSINKINIVNDPIFNLKFLEIDKENKLNSIINLYAALVNKKIFYRNKSKLNGAPFLIGISDSFTNYFNKTNFKEFCTLYNQYLNLNTPEGNIRQRIRKWINKDRIPFPIIRLISILNKNDYILIEFSKNLISITDRTGKSRFKPPYLLKDVLNPQRLYDIGVSIGDGGLFNHEQMISDGTIKGERIDLTERYIKTLKNLKIAIWNLDSSSINIERGKGDNQNMFRLTVSNQWFINYLNFVYNLPIGDKIRQNLKVPTIIDILSKEEKNKLLPYLYRGLFDSDGHHSLGSSISYLYTASQTLKKQVIEFLTEQNIKHTVGKEEIRILSDDYKRFVQFIGSSHPRKLENMLKRLSIEPKSYLFKGVNKAKLNKQGEFDYLKNPLKGRIKISELPMRPSKDLIKLARHLIPQKDNNKCLIKREGMGMTKEEIKELIKKLEKYFNCKIKKNPSSRAYLVHNSSLTRFLREFFIYEKSWQPLNKEELNQFYNKMINFMEVKDV